MVAQWQSMAHSISYIPSFPQSEGILFCGAILCDGYSRMKDAMEELAPGNKITMKLSEDGSGKGAAIVAAVACRLKRV